MENDGLVQECGYLYFRNITVIAMRRIDRRGAPLSCHNHDECPRHSSSSFQIWLTLQVPTQVSSIL